VDGGRHRRRRRRRAQTRSRRRGNLDLADDFTAQRGAADGRARRVLENEVDGAELERAQSGCGRQSCHTADDDDSGRRLAGQFFQEIEAVAARHLQVKRQYVRRLTANQIERGARIVGDADDAAIAARLDIRGEEIAGERRIVGDGDTDHDAARSSRRRDACTSRSMLRISTSSWNGFTM